METSSAARPATQLPTDLHAAIVRRAREIYERSGKIAGRDIENWIRAESEVLSERKHVTRLSAIVVRLNGVQYVGEFRRVSAAGYTPGEFAKGDPVPIRFEGDQMFVRRRNGKELVTRIVKQVG